MKNIRNFQLKKFIFDGIIYIFIYIFGGKGPFRCLVGPQFALHLLSNAVD